MRIFMLLFIALYILMLKTETNLHFEETIFAGIINGVKNVHIS